MPWDVHLFVRIKMALAKAIFLVFVITVSHVEVIAKHSMKSRGKYS